MQCANRPLQRLILGLSYITFSKDIIIEIIMVLFTLLSCSMVTHKRRICTQVKLLQIWEESQKSRYIDTMGCCEAK